VVRAVTAERTPSGKTRVLNIPHFQRNNAQRERVAEEVTRPAGA
jgi:hypothetical protein